MSHFERIKKHLSCKRVDKVNIEKEAENGIQFTIQNKYTEKYFVITHFDHNHDTQERPTWHYYYVWFEQENYPTNDGFVSIVGGKWCTDEEDVIREIERCCRNWNR